MEDLVTLCFSEAYLNRIVDIFKNAYKCNSLKDGCVPGLMRVLLSKDDSEMLLAMLASALNCEVKEVDEQVAVRN